MRTVILSARTGWHTDELCRALGERGHLGVVLPYEGLVAHIGGSEDPPLRHVQPADWVEAGLQTRLTSADVPVFDADVVLARIIPGGSLEQIIFRVDALHWIEDRGIPVINSPRAIERTVNKFYTTALLREAGLPTPETVVCESIDSAMTAVRAMGDVVIKPIFGSLGHGMVRVSDPDVAIRVVRALEQTRAVFYVQRAIDHGGRDVRAFVVGGRVLGAIERHAPEGDWRTNVARGASARAFELPPAWEQLALRAAAAVGADYAGVDLLPSRDGEIFVLEVNGIPGWEGLQTATGLDVAGAIVDHAISRVNARRAADASAATIRP
jgi:RimK family alpha-L-glutamate ligase